MSQGKKVALVTGANRGIGFETAKQLGEKGITVVVAARKLSDAEQTAAGCFLELGDFVLVFLDLRRHRLLPDRHGLGQVHRS